jgi:hypothetical protein
MQLIKIKTFEGFDMYINPLKIVSVQPGIIKENDETVLKKNGIKTEYLTGQTKVSEEIKNKEMQKARFVLENQQYQVITENPWTMISMEGGLDIKINGTPAEFSEMLDREIAPEVVINA